jgi:D-alanyl-D-alanine dipeptidase
MALTPRQALEAALKNPDYQEVVLPNVLVDLRYGTTQNILKRDVYQGFQRAILHKIAAAKLRSASRLLALRRPELKFLIFDALRPHSAQVQFWEIVKGTPQQPFFADPAKSSIHSFGLAIDISIATSAGVELDLGTPFDDLTELAGPRAEPEMLASGRLSAAQLERRLVLRSIMEEAGFLQLPHEWWHYDALPGAEVRGSFRRCE